MNDLRVESIKSEYVFFLAESGKTSKVLSMPKRPTKTQIKEFAAQLTDFVDQREIEAYKEGSDNGQAIGFMNGLDVGRETGADNK
jgi:hypothetical protein